jgi:hypothetical protein
MTFMLLTRPTLTPAADEAVAVPPVPDAVPLPRWS